ncbi:SMC-Scp complex subunit ScpB [Candidatus Berkiella cookevillensis]|uniref:SMC-Scp complex subunit ScpB n=1 Tax=Candidatus Berkiella cookevillensis TaxID=437022 RepID=A0A0Q9YP80_9GAMM|nr:SMC-Scp complex subunit ScpB [Candidatus Berkiella cookevillensis]MCS5709061.1 SMC-Scp complex subunit ScpB [Candidatus Berkiella cookevillensis]
MSKEKKTKPQSTVEHEEAVQVTAKSNARSKAKSKAKSPLLANDKEKHSAKRKAKAVEVDVVDTTDSIESENISEKLNLQLKSKRKKKEPASVSERVHAEVLDETLDEDTVLEIPLSSEEFEEMQIDAEMEAKIPVGIIEQSEEEFFENTTHSSHSNDSLINQVEALIFSSAVPLTVDKIMKSLDDTNATIGDVRAVIDTLKTHYEHRGIHLVEVASGWRFQVALSCAPTIVKTLAEKPSRLSRALLETLALVAYRQPITRAEIESIRGVVVSTQMVKTLLDHEWIRVVGHKDVPGKPALYATTKTFLDDMGLKKLDELPPLSEIKSMIPQEPVKTESQPQSLEEISQLMASAQLIDDPEESTDPEVAALEMLEQENIVQNQESAALSDIDRLENLDEFSDLLAMDTAEPTEAHAEESVSAVEFEQDSLDALVDELRDTELSKKEIQKQNDEIWTETTELLEEDNNVSDLLPSQTSLIDDMNEEVAPDEEHN